MINKEYERRAAAGDLSDGRVRGVIGRYDTAGTDKQDPKEDRILLQVTESDVAGIEPGQAVSVAMAFAKDGNYLLRDLENGWAKGGLDPVPVESEVTFLHCTAGENGELDVVAYDLDTIERAAAPAYR
jgi:hypothetical protein